MRLLQNAIGIVERGWAPDALTRWGIRTLCRSGLAARNGGNAALRARRMAALATELRRSPIAIDTAAANAQHYELPATFFELVLGPHRKYSACYWPPGTTDLAAAEAAALEQVCRRAEVADGQEILELGCGWGALTLWLAERYPRARILAVSNASAQRDCITERCRRRGLANVEVRTADMNDFDPGRRFDRVVSIEMFEHMRNYAQLMQRIACWLRPGGSLFVHIFAHRSEAYTYEVAGPADWMSRYFFTGGIMPADDLLPQFQEALRLAARWRLSGEHYRRTAEAWLANLDRERTRVLEIFRQTYGPAHAAGWLHRWRVFFLSCAEMFGLDGGEQWGISHYRFVRPS